MTVTKGRASALYLSLDRNYAPSTKLSSTKKLKKKDETTKTAQVSSPSVPSSQPTTNTPEETCSSTATPMQQGGPVSSLGVSFPLREKLESLNSFLQSCGQEPVDFDKLMKRESYTPVSYTHLTLPTNREV